MNTSAPFTYTCIHPTPSSKIYKILSIFISNKIQKYYNKRCSLSSVVCDPIACDDASITGICSSAGTNVLVSSAKNPLYWMEGWNASLFFLFWLDLPEVTSDSKSENLYGLPQSIGVHLSGFCKTISSFWKLTVRFA